MKKIAKVVLALTLAISFVACGGGKKQSKEALEAAKNGDYSQLKVMNDPATGKPYDFGGMEVTIYDWWSNPDAKPASTQEEDQIAYRKYLMETYNFKCVQKDLKAGWDKHPDEVIRYCVGGGDDACVFLIDGRCAVSGVQQNLYADLSKVSNIDWKEKKWNKAVLGALKKGKSFYSFSASMPEPRQCLFFNKRILEENGFDPDEPYNLQKEGKWTWDAFEKMLAELTKDTDSDGIVDQYGMCSFNTEFTWGMLASNDCNVVVGVDKDGKYFLDTSDAELEALDFVNKMFKNYNKPQPAGAQWDYWKAEFMDGNVAFMANQEYDAQPNGMLQKMKDDFGMVCFPKGPKASKYGTLNQDNMWVIPSCYDQDKINKIMKIIDFWTDTVPGYDDPDSWKEGYYAGFRDSRAVDETMQYMMDNSKSWAAWLIPGLNYAPIAWEVCGGAAPSEAIEAHKNEIQAKLDEVNK